MCDTIISQDRFFEGGAFMIGNDKENISDIIQVLKQLDKESLLLIDSGAKLLAARQRMEEEHKNLVS